MLVFKRGKSDKYHVRFKYNDRLVQFSTGQTDRDAALKQGAAELTRLTLIDAGLAPPAPRKSKSKLRTIEPMLTALENDFRLRGILSPQAACKIRRAKKDFGHVNVRELTAERIDEYIQKRLDDGDRPATINRVTQLLGQAYRLAIKRQHLSHMPDIRHLSERGNVRKGFFNDAEFNAVAQYLPDDLRDFAEFAYVTAWRRGECASLTWASIDDDVIRLAGEDSKNGEGRSVVIEGPLTAIIERRRAVRLVNGTLTKFVFHREGRQFNLFRKAWESACIKAGLGKRVCRKCAGEGTTPHCAKCKSRTKYIGRLFHDLRRSGVRNLIRAGNTEKVAMSVSGHKSRAIFLRYDISSEDDLRQAMKKVEQYRETQAQKVTPLQAGNSRQ